MTLKTREELYESFSHFCKCGHSHPLYDEGIVERCVFFANFTCVCRTFRQISPMEIAVKIERYYEERTMFLNI